MIGIIAYGGYIPYNRLKFETIAATFGKSAKEGEKAVAYYDEDSITMAIAASLAGLNKIDAKSLDAVFFATTTSPYAEKQGATNIAAAIDTKKNIRTCDFSGSLRANSAAMLAALDSAELGHKTLVAIGDCRLGGADGANESAFGDGAAAFVFGSENVIARKIAGYSMSVDFNDMWRSRNDNIVRNWDVRYALAQSYEIFITESVRAVFAQTGLSAADFAKVVLYAHEERHQIATATQLGFKPEQIQKTIYNSIGNTGCAAAPLMLVSALEKAQPGDKLMFITYGEGCDILVFEATDAIRDFTPDPSIQEYLRIRKSSDLTYGKYLKWKSMIECEPQKRPEQERSALPDYFRNYKKNNALYGSRCTECGTPQFPPQRVCAKCHCVDRMEEYRFYGRRAWVKTFTLDGLSISLDPPNYLVVIEFEGGGKLMTYLVDCKKEDIQVNMEVVLTYRKLYEANGVHTYFWKAAPKKIAR